MSGLFNTFRFRVDFFDTTVDSDESGTKRRLCGGAFSECSGLEATMEPKAIPEGGRNFGEHQRAGRTTFSTLVLKRGMTENRDLWRWFDAVANGAYAYRMNAVVTMLDLGQEVDDPKGMLQWEVANALPIKFKAADLSADSKDIGVEELHLAHEGLHLMKAS